MNKFEEPICKVVVEDGTPFVTDKNGEKLPKQEWTRVFQKNNEPAYAIVKVFVNCVDTQK